MDHKKQKLTELLKRAPTNESLKFLCWRLKLNDYRGLHLSQHNRLTFEKFKAIVIAIVNSQDELGYIKIPRGDSGKQFYIGDFLQYGKLIESFHNELKNQNLNPQGTANSIKKNLFPDLARMNIITRFHKKNHEIIMLDPYSKKTVDFIKINSFLKLNENITDDLFIRDIYEKHSKILYANLLPLIYEILNDEKITAYIGLGAKIDYS